MVWPSKRRSPRLCARHENPIPCQTSSRVGPGFPSRSHLVVCQEHSPRNCKRDGDRETYQDRFGPRLLDQDSLFDSNAREWLVDRSRNRRTRRTNVSRHIPGIHPCVAKNYFRRAARAVQIPLHEPCCGPCPWRAPYSGSRQVWALSEGAESQLSNYSIRHSVLQLRRRSWRRIRAKAGTSKRAQTAQESLSEVRVAALSKPLLTTIPESRCRGRYPYRPSR
jgi:hypothetical protein